MIELDLDQRLHQPGTPAAFDWEGDPGFPDVTLERPLQIHAVYSRMADDSVQVTGSLKARLCLECTRCLAPVAYEIEHCFHELYVPDRDDEDAYTYHRETKRISLDQMIYDILLVDIPLQVLCSESCQGLCPHCGRNLNEGPCECRLEDDHAVSPNNPFAKLKDLF